jgi:hypothetical protein
MVIGMTIPQRPLRYHQTELGNTAATATVSLHKTQQYHDDTVMTAMVSSHQFSDTLV